MTLAQLERLLMKGIEMRFLSRVAIVFLSLGATVACDREPAQQSGSSVQSTESEESKWQAERDRCEAKKLSCEVAVSALQQRVNQTDPTSPRFDILMGQMLDKQMECMDIASKCWSPE